MKTKSVETMLVADLAGAAISAASKDGGMIAADVVARKLLDENPDCQVPFDKLRDSIAVVAVKMHVDVEFGLR